MGASLATFDTATAQRLFVGGEDEFTDIWVTAEPGIARPSCATPWRRRCPPGSRPSPATTAADEAASDVNQAVSFIGTFLLVFAGVALVVGSFLIVNTFSILVAQRSRELALFRALGSSRRQVTRSVILEALAIGLVGSTVGLGLGFLLALGIKALFATFGLDLPGPAGVRAPTALVSYAVGLLVTLFAAYLPARRAGRIAPMAALREDASVAESSIHRRVVFGAALLVLGAVGMGLGLFGEQEQPVWWIGAGIFGVVIGAALTSPLLGRPVIALTGAVYRRAFGAVGVMAEQNAVRNPRRTAATASALMIGLTLVSMMAVFGQSAKASIDRTIDQGLAADYVVSNAVGVPFSPSVTDQVAQVPGVQTVARYRFVGWQVGAEQASATGIEPGVFEKAFPVDMEQGRLADLSAGTVIISDERSRSDGTHLGDSVRATVAGTTATFRVVGVYRVSPGLGTPFLVSLATLDGLGVAPADNLAFVVREPGADPAAVKAGISRVIADLPTVTLKDQAEFAAEQRQPIDQMLYMIYALLGLAVVIAVLGIVNTLALSVIERTREIGLLRAVGLSRRQLRTMLRLESVVDRPARGFPGRGARRGLRGRPPAGHGQRGHRRAVHPRRPARAVRRPGRRGGGAGSGLARAPGRQARRPGGDHRGVSTPESPPGILLAPGPPCGPGARVSSREQAYRAGLGLGVLGAGCGQHRSDRVEPAADLPLGALPLGDHPLEAGRRLARPGVLQRDEPRHHRVDLALDLARDAGDVGRGGLDALGVDLELRRHGFPPCVTVSAALGRYGKARAVRGRGRRVVHRPPEPATVAP